MEKKNASLNPFLDGTFREYSRDGGKDLPSLKSATHILQ